MFSAEGGSMWVRLYFSRGVGDAVVSTAAVSVEEFSTWVRPWIRVGMEDAVVPAAIVSAAVVSAGGVSTWVRPYFRARVGTLCYPPRGFSSGGFSRGEFLCGFDRILREGVGNSVVSSLAVSVEGVSMWFCPYFCTGTGDAVVVVPAERGEDDHLVITAGEMYAAAAAGGTNMFVCGLGSVPYSSLFVTRLVTTVNTRSR